MTIIEELPLPISRRTILSITESTGGVAGGEKFIHSGIFFKLSRDWKHIYGGDGNAMKAAEHEIKGGMAYLDCRIDGLRLPLMALIRYRGHTMLAESIIPVDNSSLIYGSRDGGITIFAEHNDFNNKMQLAAQHLNLKAHRVWTRDHSKSVILHAPVDLEGHKGKDGLFYVIDTARVFPPVAPSKASGKGSYLYQLFRPEFVRLNSVPLSSDAFSKFGKDEESIHNDEVIEATVRLESELIPDFAKYLDSRYSTPRVDLPNGDIQPGQTEFEDDLPAAYLRRAPSRQLEELSNLVAEMHLRGINIRYSLAIHSLLSSSLISRLILTEVVARSTKHLLDDTWRSLDSLSCNSFLTETASFFTTMFSTSPESSEFWNTVLAAEVDSRFGCNLRQTKAEVYATCPPTSLNHNPQNSFKIDHSLDLTTSGGFGPISMVSSAQNSVNITNSIASNYSNSATSTYCYASPENENNPNNSPYGNEQDYRQQQSLPVAESKPGTLPSNPNSSNSTPMNSGNFSSQASNTPNDPNSSSKPLKRSNPRNQIRSSNSSNPISNNQTSTSSTNNQRDIVDGHLLRKGVDETLLFFRICQLCGIELDFLAWNLPDPQDSSLSSTSTPSNPYHVDATLDHSIESSLETIASMDLSSESNTLNSQSTSININHGNFNHMNDDTFALHWSKVASFLGQSSFGSTSSSSSNTPLSSALSSTSSSLSSIPQIHALRIASLKGTNYDPSNMHIPSSLVVPSSYSASNASNSNNVNASSISSPLGSMSSTISTPTKMRLFSPQCIKRIAPRTKYLNRISFEEGTALIRLAISKPKEERFELLARANRRFEECLNIKPDDSKALVNWAMSLTKLATMAGSTNVASSTGTSNQNPSPSPISNCNHYWKEAFSKYERAVMIRPNDWRALSQWGTSLLAQVATLMSFVSSSSSSNLHQGNSSPALNNPNSTTVTIKECVSIYYSAIDKFDRAIKSMSSPQFNTLYNVANARLKLARLLLDDLRSSRTVRADKAAIVYKECSDLLNSAISKFQEALAIEGTSINAMHNLAVSMATLARIHGQHQQQQSERDRLYNNAYIVYQRAIHLIPTSADIYYGWGNALFRHALAHREAPNGDDLIILTLLFEASSRYQCAIVITKSIGASFSRDLFINFGNVLNLAVKIAAKKQISVPNQFVTACSLYLSLSEQPMLQNSESYSMIQVLTSIKKYLPIQARSNSGLKILASVSSRATFSFINNNNMSNSNDHNTISSKDNESLMSSSSSGRNIVDERKIQNIHSVLDHVKSLHSKLTDEESSDTHAGNLLSGSGGSSTSESSARHTEVLDRHLPSGPPHSGNNQSPSIHRRNLLSSPPIAIASSSDKVITSPSSSSGITSPSSSHTLSKRKSKGRTKSKENKELPQGESPTHKDRHHSHHHSNSGPPSSPGLSPSHPSILSQSPTVPVKEKKKDLSNDDYDSVNSVSSVVPSAASGTSSFSSISSTNVNSSNNINNGSSSGSGKVRLSKDRKSVSTAAVFDGIAPEKQKSKPSQVQPSTSLHNAQSQQSQQPQQQIIVQTSPRPSVIEQQQQNPSSDDIVTNTIAVVTSPIITKDRPQAVSTRARIRQRIGSFFGLKSSKSTSNSSTQAVLASPPTNNKDTLVGGGLSKSSMNLPLSSITSSPSSPRSFSSAVDTPDSSTTKTRSKKKPQRSLSFTEDVSHAWKKQQYSSPSPDSKKTTANPPNTNSTNSNNAPSAIVNPLTLNTRTGNSPLSPSPPPLSSTPPVPTHSNFTTLISPSKLIYLSPDSTEGRDSPSSIRKRRKSDADSQVPLRSNQSSPSASPSSATVSKGSVAAALISPRKEVAITISSPNSTDSVTIVNNNIDGYGNIMLARSTPSIIRTKNPTPLAYKDSANHVISSSSPTVLPPSPPTSSSSSSTSHYNHDVLNAKVGIGGTNMLSVGYSDHGISTSPRSISTSTSTSSNNSTSTASTMTPNLSSSPSASTSSAINSAKLQNSESASQTASLFGTDASSPQHDSHDSGSSSSLKKEKEKSKKKRSSQGRSSGKYSSNKTSNTIGSHGPSKSLSSPVPTVSSSSSINSPSTGSGKSKTKTRKSSHIPSHLSTLSVSSSNGSIDNAGSNFSNKDKGNDSSANFVEKSHSNPNVHLFHSWNRNIPIQESDMSLKGMLGTSRLGLIFSAKKGDQEFAMKVRTGENYSSRTKLVSNVTILPVFEHPFIVPLKYCFYESEKLILMFSLIRGPVLIDYISRLQQSHLGSSNVNSSSSATFGNPHSGITSKTDSKQTQLNPTKMNLASILSGNQGGGNQGGGNNQSILSLNNTTFGHLNSTKVATYKPLDNSVMVLVAAQIVSAVSYIVDELKVPYRDFKPTNIMISEKGNIMLTVHHEEDQISAKFAKAEISYLAPEIVIKIRERRALKHLGSYITDDNENRQEDLRAIWWSIGMFLLYLSTGSNPIEGSSNLSALSLNQTDAIISDPQKIEENVIKKNIFIPSNLGRLGSLIQSLLDRDLTRRLCSGDKIKRHSYFEQIDWHKLSRMEYNSPFSVSSLHLQQSQTFTNNSNQNSPNNPGNSNISGNNKRIHQMIDSFSTKVPHPSSLLGTPKNSNSSGEQRGSFSLNSSSMDTSLDLSSTTGAQISLMNTFVAPDLDNQLENTMFVQNLNALGGMLASSSDEDSAGSEDRS